MNSPLVNNRPQRRQSPGNTTADAASSPASGPISSSSKGALVSSTRSEEKPEGEDTVSSLPGRFGRLNLFRNLSKDDDDDCAPTDEDVTETEHEDLSPRPIRQVVVARPKAATAVVGNNSSSQCWQEDEEEEEKSLLSLPELIDRLSQVTRGADKQRLSLGGNNINRNMTVEEMTRILAHINMCESSQMPARWDLIYEMALNNNKNDTNMKTTTTDDLLKQQQQQLENNLRGVRDNNELLDSSNNAQHFPSSGRLSPVNNIAVYDKDQQLVVLSEDEEWKEIEDDDEEGSEYEEESLPSFYSDVDKDGQPIVGGAAPALSDDELSLSINQLWQVPEEEEEGSGIWLDATSNSCASSVTWYEDKDLFEEIVISDDEDDEALQEILLADALSSFAGSDDIGWKKLADDDDEEEEDSYSYEEEIVDSVFEKR